VFRVTDEREKRKGKDTTVHLIRGGNLIHSFEGKTPMEITYTDESAPPNAKTYYRLIDERKNLTSNPIFVVYKPNGF
jgi:hypothetical protein